MALLCGLVSEAVTGCGGTAVTTSTGGGTTRTTTTTTTSTGGMDGGATGPCQDFTCAVPLTIGATSAVMGTLTDPFTPDRYSFTGKKGDRVQIQAIAQGLVNTLHHDPNDPTVTDTVVTLYLPDMKTIWAQDDDAFPRLGTDSTLYTELPVDGTYYLTVEDCNALAMSNAAVRCAPAAKITTLDYLIGIIDLTATQADIPGSTTTPAAITYTPNPKVAGTYYTVVLDGDMAALTDTQVFDFTPPTGIKSDPSARSRAYFWVQPYGAANGTGTAIDVVLTAKDASGNILAQADQQYFDNGDDPVNDALQLAFPLDNQLGDKIGVPFTLEVAVSGHTGIEPTQSFFFIEHFAGPFDYGAPEAEGPAGAGVNDDPANPADASKAQVLTTPTGVKGAFFVDGDISSPTDVDWYTMTVPTGATVAYFSCEAARSGSGLQGFTAQLFKDATGTSLLAALGPEATVPPAQPTKDLNNGSNGTMLGAGVTTATLKITATGQSATVKGTFYHCAMSFQ
jgi:hypothetical protein